MFGRSKQHVGEMKYFLFVGLSASVSGRRKELDFWRGIRLAKIGIDAIRKNCDQWCFAGAREA